MILKNKYSLIHRPEPPAHPFTSEALFQTISRLIPTQAQINNLYRNRIISTFWLRNLKSWRGNCMRLFRCCTRWGTLHPIRAGASSLMGCTARSATSSDAGLATGNANTTTGPNTMRRFTSPRLLTTRLLTEKRWTSDHSRACYSVALHYLAQHYTR